ncbi:hypothetical protein EDD18DRAFT_1118781 [Armillaria luteobubalina]|uniref:Uncharacterized protein n=1 Tax=Armillaria luteobubalina TaxID=153913 RepID=A0AA39NVB2_9AGAR|nr:hypothetical protein EDD18DRAFT_1118781 [Armillaria luteobubalina]
MRYYFLRVSLPRRDCRPIPGENPFAGKEEVCEQTCACQGDEAIYIAYFSSTGWHRSPHNNQYHYTLRGYNASGWMAITLEMGASGRTKVFTYGHKHWMIWSSNSKGGSLRAKYFFNSKDHEEAHVRYSLLGRNLGSGPLIEEQLDTRPEEYGMVILRLYDRIQTSSDLSSVGPSGYQDGQRFPQAINCLSLGRVKISSSDNVLMTSSNTYPVEWTILATNIDPAAKTKSAPTKEKMALGKSQAQYVVGVDFSKEDCCAGSNKCSVRQLMGVNNGNPRNDDNDDKATDNSGNNMRNSRIIVPTGM